MAQQLQISSLFCTLIAHKKLSKDLFPTVTTSSYKFSTPVEITYAANMADCRTILKAIFKCTINTKIAQISKVLLQKNEYTIKMRLKHSVNAIYLSLDRIFIGFKIYSQNCRRTSSLQSPPPCTSFLLQSKSLTLQTWLIVVLFLKQSLNAQ